MYFGGAYPYLRKTKEIEPCVEIINKRVSRISKIAKSLSHYNRSGDQIKVVICDTGSGIRQEHLEKMFDPFFTTEAPGEGTGLGLSISYRIIEEHNGSVEINSKMNEGTEVIVKLPKRKEK